MSLALQRMVDAELMAIPTTMPSVEGLNITVTTVMAAEPILRPIHRQTMLVYSNSCDLHLLETHTVPQDVVEDNSHIALLLFAAIAVVLEAVALTVLTRPASTRFGSMRLSLVALTATEMWLNSTIFVHKAWEEFANTRHEKLLEFCLSFLLFSSLNSALCSRNWAVTLIAMARCEAITRPVATRVSTHIFSPRRQLIYLGILIVCGIALSTFRLVVRRVVVCTNLDNVVLHIRTNHTSRMQIISEKIFFAYQSVIPITVVTMATLFMIIALLRHRMPWERQKDPQETQNPKAKLKLWCWQSGRSALRDEGSGCVVSPRQAVRHAQRTPNHIRATRFILFIVTVFIVCEAPVFFAVVFVSSMHPLVAIRVFTYLRFLIIADSFANFVIYLLSSRPFRVALGDLFMCRKKRHHLIFSSAPTYNQTGPSRTSINQT